GTMPVMTAAMPTYSTAEMPSAPRMPSGTSRCGLRASRAVVAAVSKPMYEKKMMPAPVSTPLQPNSPDFPVFGGMYGSQFAVSMNENPAMMNTTMTATFTMTMIVLAVEDSRTPT